MSMMTKIRRRFEAFLPMTISNLALLAVICYLTFVVAKTVWDNYQSNKQIAIEQDNLTQMESDINNTENEIVYYNSSSFKDKQARSKLAYVAPGETAISVSLDLQAAAENTDSISEDKSNFSLPNYYLWLDYFSK